MRKTRIGVLRGGPSSEYAISLQTGKAVLENLDEEKYTPVDIVVHKDGVWHVLGIAQKPEQVFARVDLLFNGLHGNYGEDGKVQRLLDMHGIPYTGSGALASALGMHKHLAKDRFRGYGIKTPMSVLVRPEEDEYIRARDIWRTFPHPAVVKPSSAGSSIGVTVADSYEELLDGILIAKEFANIVIVEEYIAGREATCTVLDDFRGQQFYGSLPVEILLEAQKKIYDYESKYIHPCSTLCPPRFSDREKHTMQEIAKQVHEILCLRHYSRSDFIVSPEKGIYLLEVNTLPSLMPESLLPKSLEAVGVSMPQFIDHIVELALPH